MGEIQIGSTIRMEEPLLDLQFSNYCDCKNCRRRKPVHFGESNRCCYDGEFLIDVLTMDEVFPTGNLATGESQMQECKVITKICHKCKHMTTDIFFGNFSDDYGGLII